MMKSNLHEEWEHI